MLTQDNRLGEKLDSTQDKFQKLTRLLESAGQPVSSAANENDGDDSSAPCTIYVLGNNNQVLANSHHNFSGLKKFGKFSSLLFLILFFSRVFPAKI